MSESACICMAAGSNEGELPFTDPRGWPTLHPRPPSDLCFVRHPETYHTGSKEGLLRAKPPGLTHKGPGRLMSGSAVDLPALPQISALHLFAKGSKIAPRDKDGS